jgi:hypothetical protein
LERRMVMKHPSIRSTLKAVLASVLVGGFVFQNGRAGIARRVHAQVHGVQAHERCSLATLQGAYLFYNRNDASGYAHDPLFPELVVGLRTFDGEGNLSQVWDRSRGGDITLRSEDAGVYTLGRDEKGRCIGTMLIAGQRNWDLFVNEDGSEGVAIRTDPGKIGFGTLKRQ